MVKKLKRRLAPCVSAGAWIMSFGVLLAPASAAQYRFEVFNSEKGLPQNSVYSILQTGDGYLWFTTLDGLVRYDGAAFKVFSRASSKGISSNRFTRLFEDRDRQLWICTEDGGLTRYSNGTFTTYTTADGLPSNWTLAMRQAPSGDLFVQAHGGPVVLENGRFSKGPAGLDFGYQRRAGVIWYRPGLTVREVAGGASTDYPIHDLYYYRLQAYPQFYEDRRGRLWVGTGLAELLMLEGGRETRYTPKDGLPGAPVTAFCDDRDGALWFGTDGAGLARFRDGKFTTLTARDGLPSNHISSVYEDGEGSLWIGTYDAGVAQLSEQIITSYSDPQGLPGHSYYPMIQDRQGSVWMGSDGLFRLKDDRFSYYALLISPVARKLRSRYKAVYALYEDTDGRIWIGSDIDLFSFKDGKFIVETYRRGFDFSQTGVSAILRDSGGTLWFGTRDGIIGISDSGVRRYMTADGLPSNDVHSLLQDHRGDLWIGTYGGLARLSNGSLTAFTEKEGLSGSFVRTIYEDGDGTLWIGTYDGGLNRLKDGRFTRYTTSEGLFSNGVFQILEDDSGNIWMSSNRGIFRVSRQQLDSFAEGKIRGVDSISYGTADGMPTSECNGGKQPAGFKARDGRLWFPTTHGIAVVDPSLVRPNPSAPRVLIERALLGDQEMGLAQGITLEPGRQGLEIRYKGLSYIKPEHVRFRYEMEGLDPGWTEAGSVRSAFYPNLPPGNYVFKVTAANSDGVWNDQGAELAITVIPPFYRTWWFAGLLGLMVLGVAGAGYRYRVRQLTQARVAQEEFSRRLISSQESERKRIAAELHDSLNQSLVIIKNRAVLSLNSPEDTEHAFEQLEEIAGAATRAIDEVREIAQNLRPFQLDRLGLTKSIESMVRRAATANGLSLMAELEPIDGLLSKDSEVSLYRIIQESLNNILKHARATEARVSLGRKPRELLLTIRDNGIGISPSKIDASGPGFGLAGMNERVRILGGTIAIDSAEGQGTTITVRIPI